MSLKAMFKPHPPPAKFQELLELSERFDSLADDFYIYDPASYEGERELTQEWFDREPNQRLITIGTGGDGALYVLWCYDDTPPEQAPVGYLGSDGYGNTLLAKNLDDLLELLATEARWDPGADAFYTPPRGYPSALRSHYRQIYGEPRTADEIRAAARASHPDFQAWIDTQER